MNKEKALFAMEQETKAIHTALSLMLENFNTGVQNLSTMCGISPNYSELGKAKAELLCRAFRGHNTHSELTYRQFDFYARPYLVGTIHIDTSTGFCSLSNCYEWDSEEYGTQIIDIQE